MKIQDSHAIKHMHILYAQNIILVALWVEVYERLVSASKQWTAGG